MKKLAASKQKIKDFAEEHAPEILVAVVSTAAFATYIAYSIKNRNQVTIELDNDAMSAYVCGSLTKFVTEDSAYFYTITAK